MSTIKKVLGVTLILCLAFTLSCKKESAFTTIKKNAVPAARTTQRSFSDFLAAQKTWNGVQYWGNTSNVLAWGAAIGSFNGSEIRSNSKSVPLFILADYTGFWSKILKDATGNDVGTTVTGKVTESTLSDGTAEITAEVHTKNSIMWATEGSFIDWSNYCDGNVSASDMVFGYTMDQLVGDKSLTPALCNMDFKIIYTESSEGADFFNLSDQNQCVNSGVYPIKSISINVSGSGILHPGSGVVSADKNVNCAMQQVDLLNPKAIQLCSATSDAFPAEKIVFSK
jgi:hypothetical protein